MHRRWTDRSVGGGRARLGLLVAMVVAMVATIAVPAFATHYEASLEGSKFEIDHNANLKVNVTGNLDWANVQETRKQDKPTGQNDDSYQGGVKEDTACPGQTTGSIPNNKSDLLNFGVYVEDGDPGFLHLFWNRVSEPSGTTLMDFELNQSSTACSASSPNRIRTVGDLLIEYRIDQGGARASIFLRKWTGSAWGTATQDLVTEGNATGTINSSAIPANESDGLGAMNARTFGEASIDLDVIFDPNKCTSFGSAFLKSRASTSFTSQLKDFIEPEPINLTNCGKVIIRKVTDPSGSNSSFSFQKSFATDPGTSNTFNLTGNPTNNANVKEFTGVLFGENYTVTETLPLPSGWDFVGIDCNVAGRPSVGVTPQISGRTVTFSIDDESDVLDCTYTNRARGTLIVEKVSDAAGSFPFEASVTSPATAFTLTTTAAGQAGKASRTFSNLAPGNYSVTENVPTGWDLTAASCAITAGGSGSTGTKNGSTLSNIAVGGGQTVTCTFTDARQTGAIEITKTRKHAASGRGDHPHAGVTFTISGGGLAQNIVRTTDANGKICVDGLLLSSFTGVGSYSVTETVPAGYQADGPTTKSVNVTLKSSCGDGNEAKVGFSNTPLTNITVSVDSIVPGGTASTIECKLGTDVVGSASTATAPGPAQGDGSLTLSNRPPGIYVCTIDVDP